MFVILSHGNSTLERGFSINKQILEAHGYTIYLETLEALRLVKDELNQVGDVFNFDITCSLLDEVKLSCSRYETDRIERKALEEKELVPKKRELEEITRKAISEKENESINGKINQCKCSLKVPDDLILDAKTTLQES